MNTEQKWLPMLSRAAAAGLAGLGLALLLSWLWAIGYLILKAAVGAQVFCAATAMTLLTALAAAIVGSCIFHKKLRNRTKKKKRKQKRYYGW